MRTIRNLFFAIGFLFLLGCGQDQTPSAFAATGSAGPDSIATIHIASVGDLMCHAPQFTYASVGADTFDFRPCFSEIRKALTNADFTIGNLETVFAGKETGYKGYPNFNTPDDYLDALKFAGFDFLVTANNHSLDQGEKGVLRTLTKLDEYGFDHTGTHASAVDRDSVRVVNVKGIRIAIVNFTYGMNGYKCPAGKEWMVNVIDSTLIRKDIAAAKSKKPDLVLAFFHWGNEYEHEPNAYQKQSARFAIDAGADLILGAHPHVIQPVEKFKTVNGSLDSGLVVWSMGNFFSNQVNRYTDAGVVMHLKIEKNFKTGKMSLQDVGYTPTWVYRAFNPSKKIHVIVPAEFAMRDTFPLSYVTADYRVKAKQAFQDTELYINKYRKLQRWEMSRLPD